ncbi:carbohydrate ABC transporter permease [Deinococcus cellulosilyticus]|uniref:Glycerol-3-phosphate ABC transporter permease n=1 Tax=Deinococcus cellulosilyticus (strain DSM 18568 / NBRC 106333 / KACC 11606 / 5516J-15) TaxID=1223518 RepID=A0A511N774_DEIC1|nr:carbohydrate ABC transporter permease [Deinococcus cellulosilyticus]GEM48328.1 glycerol-3-phosphate ABC transporter permease [Deinococcus cellulosilyticus NBRC 106333 = KACC 11606]
MAVKTVPYSSIPQKRRNQRQVFLQHLILSLTVFVVAFPLIFAVIKATQDSSQVVSANLMPGTSFFANLKEAWDAAHLGTYMRNSFIVAITVTVGKTLLSMMAALAFVYFRFPFKTPLFALVLFSLMLPAELKIVALFDLVNDLNWVNTYQAIIVPFLASATGTFLFRQHFMNIPRSMAEAAQIDGASPWQFLWLILIPMSLNTIGALGVIQFVYIWDQYLWPLVIIRDVDHQVVQVGLRSLIGSADGTNWGSVMAGTIVSLLPPLVMFTLLQEQFSRGIALSQEK